MATAFTPKKTMSLCRMGDILLQTCASVPIAQDEWDAYVKILIDDFKTNQTPKVAIQCTYNETPSTAQRKQMVEQLTKAIGENAVFERFALVTKSSLVRGAMTAVRWAYRGRTDMRAFAPGLEREALAWLHDGYSFELDAAYAHLSTDAEVTGYPGFKAK